MKNVSKLFRVVKCSCVVLEGLVGVRIFPLLSQNLLPAVLYEGEVRVRLDPLVVLPNLAKCCRGVI